MWLFLIILFVLSFIHTTVNLSLFTRKRYILVSCFVIAAVSFIVFPFAIEVNVKILGRIMSDFNVLSLICTYQIIESIFFMLLSLLLIGVHYEGKRVAVSRFIPLLPSGVFLAGIFYMETYLFHVIDNVEFHMTALFLSVMLFVISSVTAFLLKGCFAEWEWRMELKGILSIFQILLAMFLPIILMGVKIQGTQLEVEAGKTLVSLTAMMLIALSGCLYRMQKEEGRI